jgi:hypothetical protein
VIGQTSGVGVVDVASVVEVGLAPSAPPPPHGAIVPVVPANCCKFGGEFLAEGVPVLDGDVNEVNGTNAEELSLPNGANDVGADGVDVREEAAEEDTSSRGINWEEVHGSEILSENRSTGSDGWRKLLWETAKELERLPGAGVTAEGGIGVEGASGGFVGKGVVISKCSGEVGVANGAVGEERSELEDTKELADETTEEIEEGGIFEDTVTTDDAELDPEDPCEIIPLELLDEESDIEDELDVGKWIERVGVHEDIGVPAELVEFTEGVAVTTLELFMKLDGENVDIGLDMLDEDWEVVEVAGQPLNV